MVAIPANHSMRFLGKSRRKEDITMKMKSISILLVMLIIATVFCVSISAAAEYTVNNHDSTFTVKGSLQGTKSGGYYINEYGTIRVDKNVDNPTYSRLWCTVRLFAMQNGFQVRVDNSEVYKTVVTMGTYAGTSTYTFSSGTVTNLTSSYEADAIDGTSFRPDDPSETLILE